MDTPSSKMKSICLKLLVTCSLIFLASGYSTNDLPILSFDEGYSQLFGDSNLMLLKDGKSVHISLDQRTGANLLYFLHSLPFFCNLFPKFFIFYFLQMFYLFFSCVCLYRLWICVTRPLPSWLL